MKNNDYTLPDGFDEALLALLNYCRRNGWAGYDPYDALNSRLFACTPFSKSRVIRIGVTQILKRLPVNIRPLLLIKKEENPKGAALFLKASLMLSKLGMLDGEDLAGMMASRLAALRSTGTPYWCWGYSFPWQTRTILVPRGAPNLVSTYFAADALMDAYDERREAEHLKMALSAAEYLLKELYWSEGPSTAGFCYPLPGYRSMVHNSNLLGAALLCRAYKETGDKSFLAPALKVARYSAAKQNGDGSWYYGERPKQRWVDNFHTGYNLCALSDIARYGETSEFEPHLIKGFEFYRKNFFRKDGAPKYFHDRTYPIDVHSVAQSIITLTELSDLAEESMTLARSVLCWAMENMRDKRGYFYYQVKPYYKIRIPYMRWGQAWMLLALSTLLKNCRQTESGATGSAINKA